MRATPACRSRNPGRTTAGVCRGRCGPGSRGCRLGYSPIHAFSTACYRGFRGHLMPTTKTADPVGARVGSPSCHAPKLSGLLPGVGKRRRTSGPMFSQQEAGPCRAWAGFFLLPVPTQVLPARLSCPRRHNPCGCSFGVTSAVGTATTRPSTIFTGGSLTKPLWRAGLFFLENPRCPI
jgi:hypothetical protein